MWSQTIFIHFNLLMAVISVPKKIILMWTPFYYKLLPGNLHFITQNCSQQNCYLTRDRSFISDVSGYDAIVFDAFFFSEDYDIPQSRSQKQIYVFSSVESAVNFPQCDNAFNDFYNLTFSYKLDSDVPQLYFYVSDNDDRVIGPNENMYWINNAEMLPVDNYVKEQLRFKNKAAAWLVSHCTTHGKREEFVERLNKELGRYKLGIDIYGGCGTHTCGSLNNSTPCWNLFQLDYFFYLSFENSITEDYVTEKVLNPLLFYTVPIVYGGANYSRFLPDGSYLNALKLKEKRLAKEMFDIIHNKTRYYSFFKWKNHYTYHMPFTSSKTDAFCHLCESLHEYPMNRNTNRKYKNFVGWWNLPGYCENLNSIDYINP